MLRPAGLPPDIIKKLRSAFAKAVESKEVRAVIDKLDMLPVLYGGKEYDELLKSSWFITEKSLRETGLIKEPATSPY
jgi:tripartite-type tricarboxylate transporter receptor subunit TctC